MMLKILTTGTLFQHMLQPSPHSSVPKTLSERHISNLLQPIWCLGMSGKCHANGGHLFSLAPITMISSLAQKMLAHCLLCCCLLPLTCLLALPLASQLLLTFLHVQQSATLTVSLMAQIVQQPTFYSFTFQKFWNVLKTPLFDSEPWDVAKKPRKEKVSIVETVPFVIPTAFNFVCHLYSQKTKAKR